MKKLSKYKWIYFVSIFLSSMWIFQGCCKCDDPSNPECRNYDPCYEARTLKADFGAGYIHESEGHPDYNNFYPDTTVYFDGDTIPGTCTFYAYTEGVDSFYWRVGHDTRVFRGKRFYLEFDQAHHMKPIPVRLIVLKKSDCFASGYVRDTIEKTLVVSSRPFNSPSTKYFNSKYWGTSTEFPNDSFEIEFKGDIERIDNMPRGIISNTALHFRDYDELLFTGQSNKTIWLGSAKFQPDNRRKVVIRYKVSYDLGETSNWYTYTGYRKD